MLVVVAPHLILAPAAAVAAAVLAINLLGDALAGPPGGRRYLWQRRQ